MRPPRFFFFVNCLLPFYTSYNYLAEAIEELFLALSGDANSGVIHLRMDKRVTNSSNNFLLCNTNPLRYSKGIANIQTRSAGKVALKRNV